MAPHLAAARATTLFTRCSDEIDSWPRGHPADGGDDETGLKADGALSQKAAELLDASDAEPDGDRRLALARRAYAHQPRWVAMEEVPGGALSQPSASCGEDLWEAIEVNHCC